MLPQTLRVMQAQRVLGLRLNEAAPVLRFQVFDVKTLTDPRAEWLSRSDIKLENIKDRRCRSHFYQSA